MLLFRLVRMDDLASVMLLAQKSGVGLTTLPDDQNIIFQKIQKSLFSVDKKVESPADEYYFFVLEDVASGEIIGCSAIDANIGFNVPFYTYKNTSVTRSSKQLDVTNHYGRLSLVNDLQGATEICTLFLDKEYRKNNNGKLLSYARFLFMKKFENRFSNFIIAEMRGYLDEASNSPFWESLGKKFFHLEFHEVDKLSITTDRQFIADLMPRSPIYTSFLSEEALHAIGRAHDSTQAAMKILLAEGFHQTDCIDIFDGGPMLAANLFDLNLVNGAQEKSITEIKDITTEDQYIICNADLDFKAVVASLETNNDECILDKKSAELLKVNTGDKVSFSLFKGTK